MCTYLHRGLWHTIAVTPMVQAYKIKVWFKRPLGPIFFIASAILSKNGN